MRGRFLAVALVVVAAPAVVRADATTLLREARLLYADGEFKDALKKIETLLAESPSAELRAEAELYRGYCHFKQGHEDKAREAFGRAIDADPTVAPDPRRVGADIRDLFSKVLAASTGELKVLTGLGRAAIVVDDQVVSRNGWFRGAVAVGVRKIEVRDESGKRIGDVLSRVVRRGLLTEVDLQPAMAATPTVIRVSTEPSGAMIEIDGQARGVTIAGRPIEIAVEPAKEHMLRGTLAGHVDWNAPFRLLKGESRELTHKFEKVGDKPKVEVTTSAPPPSRVVRSPLKKWAIGTSIASGVFLVTATVLGAIVNSKEKQLSSINKCFASGDTSCSGVDGTSEYGRRVETGRSFASATNVFWGLTGATAVGAVVLFILGRDRTMPVSALPLFKVGTNQVAAEVSF